MRKSYRNTLAALTVMAALPLAIQNAYAQAAAAPAAPSMSAEDFAKAKQLYFDRCAGCHGTLRKGATGPNITDETVKKKSYDFNVLKVFITNGTPGGMPGFAGGGEMSEADINLVANYLMLPPPSPPEMPLAEIKDTCKLVGPEDKRPRPKWFFRLFMGFDY